MALVDEARGGRGIDVLDGLELVRLAGQCLVPAPLAETMLANLMLTRAGLEAAAGAVTLAPATPHDRLQATRSGRGWRITGVASRVPWARTATEIVAMVEGLEGPLLARVPFGDCTLTHGANLAGLPRDTVTLDAHIAIDSARPMAPGSLTPLSAGAGLRAIQIAGALERVLDMTVDYVQQRMAFGRTLGSFQAVQQELARLAGQVAAAAAAADAAADVIAAGTGILPIAAAKARCAEAAGIASSIAHQMHGALGFTDEYPLSVLTRHLLSWRDEFGSQAHWSRVLGEAALGAGGDGLWTLATGV